VTGRFFRRGRSVYTSRPSARFTVTYPSGTVIPSFYAGGATLIEVRVTHPLAAVEVVEESLVDVGSRA
jgi:hypothetical protein